MDFHLKIIVNSQNIIKLLQADGWYLVHVVGSHHQFKHHAKRGKVTVPHPRKDLPSAIQDAVEAHFHGSTDPLPPPSSLLSLSQHPDYQGGIRLLANIDQDRLGYNLSSNSPPESAPLESHG